MLFSVFLKKCLLYNQKRMVILDFKGLLILIDEANDQKGFNDQ